MKFSIIIPAFNEAPHIKRVIMAAKALNLPNGDTKEVIVVDNDSSDATSEIAKKAGADKVVLERKRGTNMARERGFRESRGEIVAYLDADCVPPKDWLIKIKQKLSKENVVAVSGPYDYEFRGLKKLMDKFYTKFVLPNISEVLYFLFGKKAGVIIGGNFAVKRSALEAIGGLPPLSFYGDDATTAMLLSRQAGKVVFDPNLLVKSSSRRFEKYGLLPVTLIYAFHYFKVYFKK
jgi:glycosyltransferase involved in cell wall biosynthesis